MLNNEFEKQVESALLFIAQEQIPDTPHRFPSDFEAKLVQKATESGRGKTLTTTIQTHPAQPSRSTPVDRMPRILTWGSLAAGIMVAFTVGAVVLHVQQNEMQQLSSFPVETIEYEAAATSQTERSSNDSHIENTQTNTVTTIYEQNSHADLNVAEQTTFFSENGETGAAMTTNATNRTQEVATNALQVTETQDTETVDTISNSEQDSIPEEIFVGDFDLDGCFTPADCAWAYLIRQASQSIPVIDMLPLTDNQREQCALISYEELSRIDPNGDAQQRMEPDTEFYTSADTFEQEIPLSSLEYAAVMETGRLAYTFKLFPNLNVQEYLNRQSYYNNYIVEKLPDLQNDPPALNMQEQEKWITLRNMSAHYIHDLQIEKNNDTHEVIFKAGDDQLFGDVTWEQLLAALEEAKSWKGCVQFTLTAFQDQFDANNP